jgi:hypothetical protein
MRWCRRWVVVGWRGLSAIFEIAERSDHSLTVAARWGVGDLLVLGRH